MEIERQLGERSTVSAGYQYVRGANPIILINQNVPVLRRGRHQQRLPAEPGLCEQHQHFAVGVLGLSRAARVVRAAAHQVGYYRVSYTLSKAMDNVGEFFFSSPIDPFDLSKDWGRSDDDQRHRIVVNGTITSSMEPALTRWQHFTHGFQLSTMLQYYSALPLNITSGVTTIQGTAGRPIVEGAYIPRNAGIGPDFFSWSLRVSRVFKVGSRAQVEGLAEIFNLTNHVNAITMIGNFGPGAYPTNPAPTFGDVTGVGEPRSAQLAVRVKF